MVKYYRFKTFKQIKIKYLVSIILMSIALFLCSVCFPANVHAASDTITLGGTTCSGWANYNAGGNCSATYELPEGTVYYTISCGSSWYWTRSGTQHHVYSSAKTDTGINLPSGTYYTSTTSGKIIYLFAEGSSDGAGGDYAVATVTVTAYGYKSPQIASNLPINNLKKHKKQKRASGSETL